MPGRYYIKTFGCQMNEYDSTRMGDVLGAGAGLTPTDNPADADVLLMNTCSVREKAEDKVYSLLGEWRELKKLKPHVLIGVGGCVASQEGDAITRRAPYVDLVFGPQTLHRLPDMLGELKRTGRAVVDVSFPEIEKFDKLPPARAEGASAFVSVMEGCSKYCTFCVVPYTRGDEVSRSFDSVMEEVRQLAAQGVGEITLLGQNVNAYAGPMTDGTIVDLATLIHYVAEVPGVERIRFTTSHPVEFGDSLIEAYANVPKLADHLHLAIEIPGHADRLRGGRGHQRIDRVIDHGGQIHEPGVEHQAAADDARHIEDVVDQLGLRRGILANHRRGALNGVAIVRALPQDVRPPHDGVEGCPQFVRERAQELVFQTVGFLDGPIQMDAIQRQAKTANHVVEHQ